LRAVASLGESNVLFHLHNVDTLLPEYIQSKREMAPILILSHSILHNSSLVKFLKVKEFLYTFENWERWPTNEHNTSHSTRTVQVYEMYDPSCCVGLKQKSV
jgi:hypothetical protein